MTETKPTPEELLAAYASGALRGAEAAQVEELVARDPAARAELEAMRSTLAAVRKAEPQVDEPDWNQMARAIRAACVPSRPGWRARLRGLLRPQHALLGAVVAGAAALLIVMLLRRHPDQTVAVTPTASEKTAQTGTPGDDPDLRFAEVDAMDDEQLAALEAALGAPAVAPQADDPDLDLDDEDLAELAATSEPAGGELGLGMFESTGYDDWLGSLSEDDLDALEAGLDG